MKKVLFAALLLWVSSISAFANNGTNNGKEEVSSYTKAVFSNQFTGAENVTWTTSANFRKATFTREGKTMTALYNDQNKLVATTELVEVSELAPMAIKNLIKLFPNHQMGEITKYNGSEVKYYVNLKNEKETFLVEITPDMNVSFFKAIE